MQALQDCALLQRAHCCASVGDKDKVMARCARAASVRSAGPTEEITLAPAGSGLGHAGQRRLTCAVSDWAPSPPNTTAAPITGMHADCGAPQRLRTAGKREGRKLCGTDEPEHRGRRWPHRDDKVNSDRTVEERPAR